jgi:hypothetical protein
MKGRPRDGLAYLAEGARQARNDFPFLTTTILFMRLFVPTKWPSANQLQGGFSEVMSNSCVSRHMVGPLPRRSHERTICLELSSPFGGRFGPGPHGVEVERTITVYYKDLTKSMEQTVPLRNKLRVIATTPCRGSSLSR